jgi:hypothetical protein
MLASEVVVMPERKYEVFDFTEKEGHILNFLVIPNFYMRKWFGDGVQIDRFRDNSEDALNSYVHQAYHFNFYDYVKVNSNKFDYSALGLNRNYREYYNALFFLNGYYSKEFRKYLNAEEFKRSFATVYANFLFEIAVANMKHVNYAFTTLLKKQKVVELKEIVPVLPKAVVEQGLPITVHNNFSGRAIEIVDLSASALAGLHSLDGIYHVGSGVVEKYSENILSDFYNQSICEITNYYYDRSKEFGQLDYQGIIRVMFQLEQSGDFISGEIAQLRGILTRSLIYVMFSYYSLLAFIDG